MPGETSLPLLLASLRPMLDAELYTFASVDESVLQRLGHPLAVFREAEGVSVIVSLRDARTLGLEARGELRRITLRVHSSLEAVGLTAAVSRVLTEAGIACNVVAATHHDHLFVPARRAEEAQAILVRLQRSATGPSHSPENPTPTTCSRFQSSAEPPEPGFRS